MLALPTNLLSLVLESMPDGVLVCYQEKQYDHRTHSGMGVRRMGGIKMEK